MIPKWYRRIVYKRLLKRAYRTSGFYLCYAPKRYFPFVGIRYYKELWENRDNYDNKCIKSFYTHQERTDYIEMCLKMVS